MNVSIFRQLVSKRFGFLILYITLSLAGLASPSLALAANCWKVTGWSNTNYVGAQAILVDATSITQGCTTTPTNTGWINVTLHYGTPPNNPGGPPPNNSVWLLIPLNDTHVNGLVFSPLLVFQSYNGQGTPIIFTDLLVGPNPNTMQISPNPPLQPAACVAPPNSTMVAWYPFDEPTGTTAADLAAGNTGTHSGSPLTLPGGKVAGALSFDGINDYVEVPSTMNINFGPANTPAQCSIPIGGLYSNCLGDFSIDVWVNLPPNTPNNVVKIIVDKREPSPLQGYSFFLGQNGRLGLQLASNGSFTNYSSSSSNPSVPYDGNWHHIAVTVDRRVGTFGVIKWYVDGLPLATSASTTVFGSLVNNSPLRIGTRTAASPLSGWFFGDMDELEIVNRVLTDKEVKDIFLASNLGKCKPVPPPPPCGGNPSTC